MRKVPMVAKNCDASLGVFGRKSCQCAAPEQSSLGLATSALRVSGLYGSECGYKRFGSRSAHGHPRISLLAPDFPAAIGDGSYVGSPSPPELSPVG